MRAKGVMHPVARKNRRLAVRTLAIQALLGVILSALFGAFMAFPGMQAAAAGMLVALVPSSLFTLFAYQFASSHYAPNVIRYFFIAEVVKWFALVVMFSAAFIVLSGPWLPFFLTVMVLLHVQWVAPFFLNSKTS